MPSTLELHANQSVIPRRFIEVASIPGASAATAANYGVFFIADSPARAADPLYPATAPVYQVATVLERHENPGTDAGAVTVMLKKVTSGQAISAGADVLAAGISLKAAANTNQTPTLHATTANLQLAPGDALALVTTGTLTAVAGVSLMVELRRI